MFKKIAVVLLMGLTANLAAVENNIKQQAVELGNFKVLLKAAGAAGLAEALEAPGPFTVMAPSDEAFSKLPSGTLEFLLKKENRSRLVNILKYHIVPGKLSAANLVSAKSLKTLSGDKLTVSIKNGALMINDSGFTATDVVVSNGIIHAIDKVLIPLELSVNEKIMATIKAAVNRGVEQYNSGDSAACGKIYELCIISILNLASEQLPEGSVSELKSSLARDTKVSDSQHAWNTRRVLDRLYISLSKAKTEVNKSSSKAEEPSSQKATNQCFKVLLEAPLPKGFPEPGPIQEIVYKSYPAYRSAKMSNSSSKNLSFMRLFGHIKKNKIAMTAPVVMDLDEQARRQSMAFLYANKTLGTLGSEGGIEVGDKRAQKYISIGMRGRETQQMISSAVVKLRQALTKQKKYKAIGSPRLLGYNSPMVPSQKRFWEVQIAVDKVADDKQTNKILGVK